MITREESGHGSLFLVGLMAGTAIGAGLALAFAPRPGSEIRERLTKSATDLGQAASREYQRVGTRVGDAVEKVTERAQTIRDDGCDRKWSAGSRAVSRSREAAAGRMAFVNAAGPPSPTCLLVHISGGG